MSRSAFLALRRAVLIASCSFIVVFLTSMSSMRAHEQATCCADPCTVGPCGCHPICDITYHNVVFYYSSACTPIEDADNCARGNCFLYDLPDEKGMCTVQCCADDWSECI